MKSNLSKFIQCNHYNSPWPFQLFCIWEYAHTQKFETLKNCFNTFQSVDEAFRFLHSLILLCFTDTNKRISEKNPEVFHH